MEIIYITCWIILLLILSVVLPVLKDMYADLTCKCEYCEKDRIKGS